MRAVARDFDLPSRIFAALTAILLVISYVATARRMRTFLFFEICHDDSLFDQAG
jgi:hypothetical protein